MNNNDVIMEMNASRFNSKTFATYINKGLEIMGTEYLSQVLGTSVTCIKQYSKGIVKKMPSIYLVRRLALVLECSIEDICFNVYKEHKDCSDFIDDVMKNTKNINQLSLKTKISYNRLKRIFVDKTLKADILEVKIIAEALGLDYYFLLHKAGYAYTIDYHYWLTVENMAYYNWKGFRDVCRDTLKAYNYDIKALAKDLSVSIVIVRQLVANNYVCIPSNLLIKKVARVSHKEYNDLKEFFLEKKPERIVPVPKKGKQKPVFKEPLSIHMQTLEIKFKSDKTISSSFKGMCYKLLRGTPISVKSASKIADYIEVKASVFLQALSDHELLC